MGDAAATIDAWRAGGAAAVDPVRFRFIEALARRTAMHEGLARQLLDARLAALLAAYADDLAQSRRVEGDAGGARQEAPPRSALAELVDHIARHAPAPESGIDGGDAVPGLSGGLAVRPLRAGAVGLVRDFETVRAGIEGDAVQGDATHRGGEMAGRDDRMPRGHRNIGHGRSLNLRGGRNRLGSLGVLGNRLPWGRGRRWLHRRTSHRQHGQPATYPALLNHPRWLARRLRVCNFALVFSRAYGRTATHPGTAMPDKKPNAAADQIIRLKACSSPQPAPRPGRR